MTDTIFAEAFVVKPCENGSFVIHDRAEPGYTIGRAWAFTNIADLLAFLTEQAKGRATAQEQAGKMGKEAA